MTRLTQFISCLVLVSFLTSCTDDPSKAEFRDEVIYHKRMDGNIPAGSVLFIGDSITKSLHVSSVTCRGVNYGIGGDTAPRIYKRVKSYHSLKEAGAVVLAVGINDLLHSNSPQSVFDETKRVTSIIASDIPLVLGAVHPLGSSNFRLNNQEIPELNKLLENHCGTRKHCTFLPSPKEFFDSSGALLPEMHVGDGLHLSTKAYGFWIRDLRDTLKRIDPNLIDCIRENR